MFPRIHLFKKRDYVYLTVAASIIIGSIAIANTQPGDSPLHNSMAAYVVSMNQEGQEVLETATEVEPGQVVEYALNYENTGNTALKDIVVTGPVPAFTNYIAQSADTRANATLQVSIDGGKKFESEPVKRTFTDTSGNKIEKIIPPGQYTHVRWVMKQALNAGENQQFTYRSLVK